MGVDDDCSNVFPHCIPLDLYSPICMQYREHQSIIGLGCSTILSDTVHEIIRSCDYGDFGRVALMKYAKPGKFLVCFTAALLGSRFLATVASLTVQCHLISQICRRYSEDVAEKEGREAAQVGRHELGILSREEGVRFALQSVGRQQGG